jgi:chemotaxis protein CheZ
VPSERRRAAATPPRQPRPAAGRAEGGTARTRDAPDIEVVVGRLMAAMQRDPIGRDHGLLSELYDLVGCIQQAKEEVAALRADEIHLRIPAATDELDAMTLATEEATESILAAAEEIEQTARGLEDEPRRRLAAAVTRIYEACGFQDITGQRVTKVVRTLRDIEARIVTMARILGHELRTHPAKGTVIGSGGGELLNGPQLPHEASKQTEIDALFESLTGRRDLR